MDWRFGLTVMRGNTWRHPRTVFSARGDRGIQAAGLRKLVDQVVYHGRPACLRCAFFAQAVRSARRARANRFMLSTKLASPILVLAGRCE